MERDMDKVDTVVCPRCGEAINHLHAFCYEQNKYEIDLEKGGDGLDWSAPQSVEASATKTEFNCPECDQNLFTAYDNTEDQPPVIIDFLKGVRMTWVQDVGIRARVLDTFNKRDRPQGSYYATGYPRMGGDVGIYFVDPTAAKRGMKGPD